MKPLTLPSDHRTSGKDSSSGALSRTLSGARTALVWRVGALETPFPYLKLLPGHFNASTAKPYGSNGQGDELSCPACAPCRIVAVNALGALRAPRTSAAVTYVTRWIGRPFGVCEPCAAYCEQHGYRVTRITEPPEEAET